MADMTTDLLSESIIKERKKRKEWTGLETTCFEIGYGRALDNVLTEVSGMSFEVRSKMVPLLFELSKKMPKP